MRFQSRNYFVFYPLSFSEQSERSFIFQWAVFALLASVASGPLERVSNREMHRAVVFPVQVVARRAPLRPRVLPVHPRRVVQLHT